MSLRSLFSTTINSTESLVKGAVALGSGVGESLDWINRQAKKLNHEEVIRNEEREFRTLQKERAQACVERAEKLDLELPEKLKALDAFLGIE